MKSIKKLALKKATVSQLKKMQGGGEGSQSITMCETMYCPSRYGFCPPPHE
ncbi:hypothetical protein [Kordia zhangzhouensis]|uniref:hypothetical protein n=1 Tax=Kordia zhangzhouensis TaxID=1620405 RepID=UPI0012FC74DD|nr:hypothetical protein [Kordia zhangzhouensis]